jgi:hypothetical protein
VPLAGDDAYITNNSTFTVTLDVTPHFVTLYLGGAASTNKQSLDWASGDINGTIVIGINGGLNNARVIGSPVTLSGVVTNNGVIRWLPGTYSAWVWDNVRVENRPGALIDVQQNSQFNVSGGATAVLNNAGTFRKSGGSGLTFFSDAFTFNNTGLVDVQSGEVRVNTSYVQTGGRLNFGLSSATTYGLFTFTGAAALTGGISANAIGGFNPVGGQIFTVIAYPSHTGTFSSTNLPSLEYPDKWSVDYGPTTTALRAINLHPFLGISFNAGALKITWPLIADTGFALESTTNLTPTIIWSPVTNQVQIVGDQKVVTITPTSSPIFFRLRE